MLNKKITEKNRSYYYEQIHQYDEELADRILSSKEGYLCNVLSKEDFWILCKLQNERKIRL